MAMVWCYSCKKSMFRGLIFFPPLYRLKGQHTKMGKGLAYGILSLRYIQVSLSLHQCLLWYINSLQNYIAHMILASWNVFSSIGNIVLLTEIWDVETKFCQNLEQEYQMQVNIPILSLFVSARDREKENTASYVTITYNIFLIWDWISHLGSLLTLPPIK